MRNIRVKRSPERLSLSLPKHVKDTIAHAADMEGRSITDFVAAAAALAAHNVIESETITRLSLEAGAKLVRAIESPSEPTPGLIKLLADS
ncbi:MAG: DUF1778 domain-containing protein [Candidatus Eremiobacteraeota bacterium]|nr:DUF1778 domain-containing protein [Candidatus Eremiobacteraeota bacterium]MBC5826784.1 DUF1778 domain-containing protein [Candidatus Eremiobacteraeota bacterium]